MKKILFIVLTVICLDVTAFADQKFLDTHNITFQLQTEQWATTSAALVTVSVDATLDKLGLAEARQQLLAKLNELTNKVDWHITVFSRNQNDSGLEQLHVEAQARIPEYNLVNLRDKAKNISKPGLNFKIVNFDFTPSLAEMENIKSSLRSKLYQDAKDEIVRVNKVFPEQPYYLHTIDFQAMDPQPLPFANVALYSGSGGGAPGRVDKAPMLAVSSKLQMFANVNLATAGSGGETVVTKSQK